MITEDTVYDFIVLYMEEADKDGKLSGIMKKYQVMRCLKSSMGMERYERYEPFISASIEFIIKLSKGYKIKNINKTTGCF